jgi:hypothetical protein
MSLNDQEFRRYKRVTFSTRVGLVSGSGGGGSIEEASTIDLSESGVCLRLSGRLVPGQVVNLYLSKRPEPCRVVWIDPSTGNKEFVAGLEFLYPLPDLRNRPIPPSSRFEPIN